MGIVGAGLALGAKQIQSKVMAMTVIDLLCGEAETAADIVRGHTPVMTKDKYLVFMRGMNSESLFLLG